MKLIDILLYEYYTLPLRLTGSPITLKVRAELALNTTCLPHKLKSALDFQFSSLNFAEKKIYEKLLSFLDMNKCSYTLINCRK